MRTIFSLKILLGILTIPLFFACAPNISVVSCTSQVFYPGQQEEKPFQEIVLVLDTVDTELSLDSLSYGDQTLLLRGNKNTRRCKAEGTSFTNNATLYYSKKNKQGSIVIDSISQLKPLYLP